MAKNVLIICTSLRNQSNSEALADAFLEGAEAAGNHVEKLTLKDKQMTFCKGCFACLTTKQCVIRDDAPAITEKMRTADVIVFATPIYYYEMCGQMKTLLDRSNSLFASDYSFRDIYMLSTAAEEDAAVPARAVSGLTGWIDCFENAVLSGTVFAGGVNAEGEISNHPALEEAYDMGLSIQ